MADLDTLRPEVREAVKNFDDLLGGFGDVREFRWQTIRAELLRLAKENTSRPANADEAIDLMATWINRAQKAEAELAAIKERLAESPIAQVRTVNDSMGGITRTYVCHESQACIVLPSLEGKRVRLVVEG